MADECSCDLPPALTAEDGSLIPYLEEKGQHDVDNEYIYLNWVLHTNIEQEGLHITFSISPGVATSVKVSCL